MQAVMQAEVRFKTEWLEELENLPVAPIKSIIVNILVVYSVYCPMDLTQYTHSVIQSPFLSLSISNISISNMVAGLRFW